MKCGWCNNRPTTKFQPPPKLTCEMLALQGCQQNETTGLIYFTEDASFSSLGNNENKNQKESMRKNSNSILKTGNKEVMLNNGARLSCHSPPQTKSACQRRGSSFFVPSAQMLQSLKQFQHHIRISKLVMSKC